mgnify:CR=1 FL=1
MIDILKMLRPSHETRKKRAVVRIQEDRKYLLTPKSGFFVREAYKILRSNVSFSLTGEESSKVILVTSSLQSEGKSITAVNLAISYAQTDRRVLLIDCDLRRPKLARLLQVKNRVGLSNALLDRTLLKEALISSGLPNLDMILSGDIPPNPSELLSSPRMVDLLDELKQQYDLIILDTPPINMVVDAVVLSPLTDGVVFIVRANHTERGAVIYAVEQLEHAKAKILGFVLNDVSLESTNYGYDRHRYRRYRSYYRYSYGGYGGYGYGGHAGYGGYIGYNSYGYNYGYNSGQFIPQEENEQQ